MNDKTIKRIMTICELSTKMGVSARVDDESTSAKGVVLCLDSMLHCATITEAQLGVAECLLGLIYEVNCSFFGEPHFKYNYSGDREIIDQPIQKKKKFTTGDIDDALVLATQASYANIEVSIFREEVETLLFREKGDGLVMEFVISRLNLARHIFEVVCEANGKFEKITDNQSLPANL